jgi:hypothetical protein
VNDRRGNERIENESGINRRRSDDGLDIEKHIDSRLKHELANIRRWTGSQNTAHFGNLDSDAAVA